jgi:TolB-like protein/Tfp pilus assembly protein PilF
VSFLAELRRRNVFRMAGLYLVGAWLIVQVAGTVLPMFGAPDWVARSVVVLLVIGFVPAVVFSWLYELTPQGLKRDGEVAPGESIAPLTARRMDRLLVIGMVAVVGVVVADRLWPRQDTPTQPGAEAAIATNGVAPALPSTPAATTANAPAAARLVAVLPFRNRSVREEDAYITEGIHDDLLTQLSRIAAFKVISRTSMMRYRDTDKSVPEIAAELGAAVLLEGAVQRSGDQVRITVQLIDGQSDVHLWAQSYDRALSTENLFAIQADIAKAIADAMRVVLSPSESRALAAGSTANLQAYEAFLRGKLAARTGGMSAERLRAVIADFDRAIALDPAYADAWSMKARAHLMDHWYVLGMGPGGQLGAAQQSLAQAQTLAPEAIETLLAEAYYHYWGHLDYARAEAVLQRVLARVPDNAEAWILRGYVARRDGRFDDAIAAMQRVLEIDPVNIDGLANLFETHTNLGQATQAAAAWSRARALGAEARDLRVYFAEAQGDAEGAWAEIDGPNPNLYSLPFRAALLTRDPERIALALSAEWWPEDRRSQPDFPEVYPLAQAEGLLVTGQVEQARSVLVAIQSRLREMPNPYPAGWRHNNAYLPCELPGLLGDLEGVLAAEHDYRETAPRDAWAVRDIHLALAIAFARAGDPERAVHYLETIAAAFGPASYLRFSIQPGLDAIREHPRYLALKAAYESWAGSQPATSRSS